MQIHRLVEVLQILAKDQRVKNCFNRYKQPNNEFRYFSITRKQHSNRRQLPLSVEHLFQD